MTIAELHRAGRQLCDGPTPEQSARRRARVDDDDRRRALLGCGWRDAAVSGQSDCPREPAAGLGSVFLVNLADDVARQIKGFASATSVNQNETLTFFVTVSRAILVR